MTRKALDTSGFLIAVIELAKLERQRAPEATEKVIDFCQKKLDEEAKREDPPKKKKVYYAL